MTRISVTELARNLADFINRVSYRGERFEVERGKRLVAELTPIPRGRSLGELPDLLASLPHLTLEDAAHFAADLDCARDELGQPPAEGASWES